MATTTVVKVVSVSNSGGVSPVGTVNVQPLVNQINGIGDGTPHGIVYGLPYFRLQGGADAIILDPKAGDIGIAVFCSRDISGVKSTKKISNPGSYRKFDWADGLYIGGVLNGTPSQYVRFASDGIYIVSPSKVTVTSPTVEMSGNLRVTGSITAGYGTGGSVGLQSHIHSDPQGGSVAPPTPGT